MGGSTGGGVGGGGEGDGHPGPGGSGGGEGEGDGGSGKSGTTNEIVCVNDTYSSSSRRSLSANDVSIASGE